MHPLFAASRHVAARQRPRECAELEEWQGDLVYQHELLSVPGKIINRLLVEYGRSGYLPAKSRFIYAIVLEGKSPKVCERRIAGDLQDRTEPLRAAR
jgi:hypothetical protein